MIVELFIPGIEGIPISYSPRTDDAIALTLLACFFLSSIALAKGKKFLSQQVKDFVLHRERTSIFDSSTAADVLQTKKTGEDKPSLVFDKSKCKKTERQERSYGRKNSEPAAG